MKKLIKMYNEKYGNTLGVIDDDFNKEQMYRIYYFIKNNCDDKDIQDRIKMINLDKPKTLEQQLTKLEGENGQVVDPTIKTDIANIKTDLGDEELTTVNKNVKGAINEVNAQYKDIANKIITTEERTKLNSLKNYDDTSVKNDIQTQKARIDSLATLKEGSTTGDAELIDGRVGANGVTYNNIGDAIRAIGSGAAIKDNTISASKVKYATDFLVDCYSKDLVLNFNRTTKEVEVNINVNDAMAYGINGYWRHFKEGYNDTEKFNNVPFPEDANTYMLVGRTCKDVKHSSLQFIQCDHLQGGDFIFATIYFASGGRIVKMSTTCRNPYTVTLDGQSIINISDSGASATSSYSSKYLNNYLAGSQHALGSYIKFNYNTKEKKIEITHDNYLDIIFYGKGFKNCTNKSVTSIDFSQERDGTYCMVMREDGTLQQVKMEKVLISDIVICVVFWNGTTIAELYTAINNSHDIITVDGNPFKVNSQGVINDDKSTSSTTYSSVKINSLINSSKKPYRFALKSTFVINFNTTTKQVEFKNVPSQAIIFDNIQYWMKSASANNTIEPVDFPAGGATFVLVAQGGNPRMQFKQIQDTKDNDIVICTVYMIDKNIINMTSSLVNFANLTINDSPYMVHPAIDDSKVSNKTTYSSEKINSLIGSGTINYAIPTDVYVVDELPIYKDSILDEINNRVFMYLVQGDIITPFDKVATITNSTETCKLGIIQNNTDSQKTITIHSVQSNANDGKSINYQAIGDSLTNRGVANYTRVKLNEYKVTANCIGTINNSTVKGEGREAWTYSNFVGRNNIYLNEGAAITPLTSKADGTLKTNPFIRLATSTDKTDHPDWCFRNTGSKWELSYSEDSDKTGDFYIFDYANYLKVQGLANPDIITIGLSTNDISTHGTDKDIVSCTEGLNIMIQQIKSALPNVKIGIIPTPVCRVHPENIYRRKKDIIWANSCMTQVSNLKSTYSDLYIVPVWIHMSRYGIYQDSDIIHWGSVGYYQYKNVIASWIMNII